MPKFQVYGSRCQQARATLWIDIRPRWACQPVHSPFISPLNPSSITIDSLLVGNFPGIHIFAREELDLSLHRQMTALMTIATLPTLPLPSHYYSPSCRSHIPLHFKFIPLQPPQPCSSHKHLQMLPPDSRCRSRELEILNGRAPRCRILHADQLPGGPLPGSNPS